MTTPAIAEIELLQRKPADGSGYPYPMQRSQTDGMGDFWSEATGISFQGTPVLTRQEYAEEADVNILLNRFGVNTPLREMQWGAEIDDRLDLQQALYAIDQAKQIKVPDELRAQFPTWQHVLNGAESGAYQHALAEHERVKKATAEAAEREEADKKSYEDWKANVRETPDRPPKREG